MEKLERGEIVSKEASKQMLDLMKREQGRNSIGRDMPGVPMASKYGALDALRSCVAILYTKQGRIAIAITVDEMPEVLWSVDNPAYLLMMRLSSISQKNWEAKAPPLGTRQQSHQSNRRGLSKILNAIFGVLYIMPRVLGHLIGKRSKNRQFHYLSHFCCGWNKKCLSAN